jgi:hypothetical protein
MPTYVRINFTFRTTRSSASENSLPGTHPIPDGKLSSATTRQIHGVCLRELPPVRRPLVARMTGPLPDGCAETPTVAVKEIMLRKSWRGRGIALLIHDELLRDRPEAQVSLPVNALNGDGKVKVLYESWSYQPISTQQPSVDGPVLTAMLRRIRPV